MSLRFLRLRRSLSSLSSLPRSFTSLPLNPPLHNSPQQPSFLFSQTRLFTPSRLSFACERKYKLYQEGDEITEDTILFPGCDYNHWLITVDFPKDPKPTPEEMVATYERICAQGLNISIEEAKKKIYACSTTTYQGFQAVMTEEESEKFKDVPGVVFVLPDSYIDPVNQQYGGDKYENGVITPRPPPVQFQNRRNRRPRYNNQGNQYQADQYDQQSYLQGGQMPNRQGNPQYSQQGFAQGGQMPNRQGNPQYSQQGFAQGGQMPNRGGNPQYDPQGLTQGQMPNHQGNPQYDQRGFTQGGLMSNQQGNFQYDQQGSMQGVGRNFRPRQDHPQQQNYGPPPMNNRDYAPQGRDGYQDTNRGSSTPLQGSYNQGLQGNYNSQDQRSTPQGSWGNQNYYSPNAENHGQGPDTGYEQGNYAPRHRGPDQGKY